jgi:hypothetical protein
MNIRVLQGLNDLQQNLEGLEVPQQL